MGGDIPQGPAGMSAPTANSSIQMMSGATGGHGGTIMGSGGVGGCVFVRATWAECASAY